MEWWGWVTWGVTALIAAGGLVLGIRAERRLRYREHWVVTDGPVSRVINRTGEDAARVHVEVFGGRIVGTRSVHRLIAADEEFKLRFEADDGKELAYRISWDRPLTGKRHHQRSKDAPSLKAVPEAETPWTS